MSESSQLPMKCIIVDDEEMATKVIQSHLSHVPDFVVVGIYHSAVEAFLALDDLEIDVLFLDIQMPKISGLEMIKMLKKSPQVVLTTAHREYAIEGFELEVVDYLLKPIGLNRFLQTISRLKRNSEVPERVGSNDLKAPSLNEISKDVPPKHIFIKANRAYQKIDFDHILHIEAIKNHIKIITQVGTHISLMAISEFERQLPVNFLRVHRSFIINTSHVLKFDKYSVVNEHSEIPIGRTYKEAVMLELKKLLQGD